MDDQREEQKKPDIDRRKFLRSLGAAAAGAAFLPPGGAEAAGTPTNPPQVLYLDSFGNIGAANPATLAMGAVPPPVPSAENPPASSTTYVSQGYVQPNILMIMVDQMSAPRWFPQGSGGGQQAYDNVMPNIANLRKTSCVFPNFFTAATACTPARASLLTGLYSQQTCMFNTLESWCQPELLAYTGPLPPDGSGTGFPTIGNVLSQKIPIQGGQGAKSPGYDSVWIGKWHLSATGAQGSCGAGSITAGPSAYGFNDLYDIPTNAPGNPYNSNVTVFPSPDGSAANEGVGGALIQPVAGDQKYYGTTFVYEDYASQSPDPGLHLADPGYLALSDGGIADAFATWFGSGIGARPWFCGVSFINPHDMSAFPYGYGLSGTTGFSSPTQPVGGYIPAPTGGFNWPGNGDETLPPLFNLFTAAPLGPSNQSWNGVYTDAPSQLPYGPNGSGVYGKPTLQLVYQNNSGNEVGAVQSTAGWYTFLNYYYWLQATVDVQVGRVLTALQNSSFASNTIVIFLSDHGDYAGSHWIHGKAFGLYEECINVPLYIRLRNQSKSGPYPYMCSSVDILPFLYTCALGNENWRSNSADLIAYLYNRESMADFIYSSSPVQRRLSSIQCAVGGGLQPYILNTTDEGFSPFYDPTHPSRQAPGHAIAFRTVDYSTTPYGGGKLGIYSFWNYTLNDPDGVPPTQPDNNLGLGSQQFEFYNYSTGQSLSVNYGETGNQVAITSGTLTGESGSYQTSFTGIVQGELYSFSMPNGASVPSYIQSAYNTALNTYLNYRATQNSPFSTWQT